MTLGKMTVAQLREALAGKGLDTSGLKAALVARLEEANAGSGDPGDSTGASARSRTRGIATPDPRRARTTVGRCGRRGHSFPLAADE